MFSQNREIVRKFTGNDSTPFLAFKGRIINVRPATLSVDVYIPHTNKTYYGVYFGDGVLSKNYRSGGLPDVDSEVIVASYSKTDAPVVIACVPPGQFNQGNKKFEFIYPGEYQIMSNGDAYVKVDRNGNVYVGGSDSASVTKTADGTSINYKKRDVDITNFSKKELLTEVKDGIISLSNKLDFYEKSDVVKYTSDEIFQNPELKNKIVGDANSIISILFGSDTSGEAPLGKTLFDCLQIVIDNALKLIDFEDSFEIYKGRSELVKIKNSGKHLSVQTFTDGGFSIKLMDDSGNEISGIVMDDNGGKLTGVWDSDIIEG